MDVLSAIEKRSNKVKSDAIPEQVFGRTREVYVLGTER